MTTISGFLEVGEIGQGRRHRAVLDGARQRAAMPDTTSQNDVEAQANRSSKG
jgi:hypothetical protein